MRGGWNYCGGAVFGDDGRAWVLLTWVEVFPRVDLSLSFLAIEKDWGFE
jgi:hypothetical protein